MSDERKGKVRGHGEGGVWQTRKADGSLGNWRGTIELGRDERGRRRQKDLTAKTKKELLAKLVAARKNITSALVVDERMTVAAYLEEWLNSPQMGERRPRTREQYDYVVRKFIVPEIGRVKLVKLTPIHVDRMMAKIAQPGYGQDDAQKKGRKRTDGTLSPRTLQIVRTSLVVALNRAERYGLVAANAAARTEAPTSRRSRIQTFSVPELLTMFDRAEDWFELVIRLAVSTGLRKGELGALRWSDITDNTLTVRGTLSREAGKLVVGQTKTETSTRDLVLSSVAVAALKAQKARQAAQRLAAPAWVDNGYVFTTATGEAIDGRNLNRSLAALCDTLGIQRRPFHALRHSFATIALENGVPLVVISKTLGHANIAVTANIYAHVGSKLQAEAVDAVAAAFANVRSGM